LSEALEQLSHAVSGVKTLTMRLSAEQFAKLESAGGRLGKTAPAFARELLMQVLGSAVAASAPTPLSNTPVASPIISITPAAATPPVIAAPPPVVMAPPPVVAPPVMVPSPMASTTSDVTAEEAASAVTIAPKRRNDSLPGIPPVMIPVAAPLAPSGSSAAVDVDEAKRSAGGPGDGRRWFNRSQQ
jgi:hypothetical protein